MAEADLFVTAPQLFLPVGAKSERSVPTADGVFPSVRERLGFLGEITLKNHVSTARAEPQAEPPRQYGTRSWQAETV